MFSLPRINPTHLEKSWWCPLPPLDGAFAPLPDGKIQGPQQVGLFAFAQKTTEQFISLFPKILLEVFVAILRFKTNSSRQGKGHVAT